MIMITMWIKFNNEEDVSQELIDSGLITLQDHSQDPNYVLIATTVMVTAIAIASITIKKAFKLKDG
jgi:hypothetical protein